MFSRSAFHSLTMTQRSWLHCGVLAATLVVSAVSPTMAATFNVNSTVDAVDANPGDGACATATGACTLRAAIQEANVNGEAPDTINLQGGTYDLTIEGTGEDAAATGDLDVLPDVVSSPPEADRTQVILAGAGAEVTILDAHGIDRIIDFPEAAGNVVGIIARLNSLTLQHGKADGDGGAIRAVGNPQTFAAADCSFLDNEATGVGGAIAGLEQFIRFDGTGLTLRRNHGRSGGAIAIGILMLQDSIVEGNVASEDGGGTVTSAEHGSTTTRTRIVSNMAAECGGFNGGAFVDDSLIAENHATNGSGGGGCGAGSKSTRIRRTSIVGNSATQDGGGLAAFGPTAFVENSTISGNFADGDGGGLVGRLQLDFSTVAHNVADTDADGAGHGSGLLASGTGNAQIGGSILAENRNGLNARDDCAGEIESVGHNLVQSSNGCTLLDTSPTDLLDVDPMLGPLGDHGGPTPTHALLVTSPAVDAAGAAGPGVDQRGVVRPQGAAYDIGAYERTPCGNGTVEPGESCDDGNTLDGDCCSANCDIESAGTVCRAATGGCDMAETCNGVDSVCPEDINPPCPTSTPTETPTAILTSTPTPTPIATDAPTLTVGATESATPTPSETPTTLVATTTPVQGTTTPIATSTPLPLCPPTPQTGCKTPSVAQKSTLTIRDKALDKNDSLTWQWLKGSPTSKLEFGAPDVTTDYALCIYDAGPPRRLVLDAEVPGGAVCGARKPKPCWKSTKTGFLYKDAAGASDGVHSILLQEGLEPGKAKIVVVGRGAQLDVPSPLALVPPITVQLVNEDGRCWEATYSAPATFEASKFKGKADPTPGPRASRTPGPSRTATPTAHRTSTPFTAPTTTPVAPTFTLHPTPHATTVPQPVCCKHCTTGKPCGDSCISSSFTCHQPPGCACF